MTDPAGQPQIYVGVEKAPGNGRRLLFVQTHGRVGINITISEQDYQTMLRDGKPPLTYPGLHVSGGE
jgi:hypothetical protein